MIFSFRLKKLALTFLFIFIGVTDGVSDNKIYKVSMTDVNRIICDDAISEVIFSEEKGLITKVSGNEVFVKFPVTIIIDSVDGTKETLYSDSSAEVFLVCGNSTHSLILSPAKIPAQTISLISAVNTNSIDGGSRDEEELLSELMILAIEDRIPASFKDEIFNDVKRLNRGDVELTIIKKRSSIGQGYTISEYHLHSSKEVTLVPTELISLAGVSNPAAILLTAETFSGWARGFVIERGVR